MRLKVGILAPFVMQIGITFLYSTITYERLELSLLATLSIYVFPILIVYILSPHFIALLTNLRNRISQQVDSELDNLVVSDRYGQEEGRTQMLENRFPNIDDINTISNSIKAKLSPLITDRAYNYYKDNYYSRDKKIKQENSLEYFEAMVLFSGLAGIFFIFDLLIVWIISIRGLNFYFIQLDFIENKWITLNLTILFLTVIFTTFYIMSYAAEKMLYYLPYSVPILFNEKMEEQYLRRETIRSLVNYNFDNLIDRPQQRAIQKQIDEVMSTQLNPLLREEIMITTRTEFANKLAWREYSKIIETDILSKEESEQSCLELLTIGEKIGPIQLDEKDLLGLHSDVQYINYTRQHWDELSDEVQSFVYFQLYRVVEFLIREISSSLDYHKDDQEFSLYMAINTFYDVGYLSNEGKNELHNLRFRRNKLMHEIGASLDVSSTTMNKSIEAVDNILENIKKEYSVEMD